jgi:predicted nucleic acid-binding protein
MDTIYVETSIISYLRQKPSSQIVAAARQVLTHQWWNNEREKYQLVVSQYVIDEVSVGDPVLAADRMRVIAGVPLLPHDPEIPRIAAEIMAIGVLPPNAQVDALHIASVAHHRIQYLLTWNCKHIANAKILPRIQGVLRDLGIPIPVICTPEELLGDDTGNE